FFDPTKTSAANITLSSNLAADASLVAAGNVQGATGNNAVATAMAQLRTDASSMLQLGSASQTTSFGEYYRDMITKLGVATNDESSSSSVYSTLTQQADTMRQSEHGVNTDDELIDMTKHQQAYAAAAKVVTTADEMTQTLLDMIR